MLLGISYQGYLEGTKLRFNYGEADAVYGNGSFVHHISADERGSSKAHKNGLSLPLQGAHSAHIIHMA